MRTYEINLRALNHGGGWNLVLLANGLKAGGANFPPGVGGYCAADGEGKAWVENWRE